MYTHEGGWDSFLKVRSRLGVGDHIFVLVIRFLVGRNLERVLLGLLRDGASGASGRRSDGFRVVFDVRVVLVRIDLLGLVRACELLARDGVLRVLALGLGAAAMGFGAATFLTGAAFFFGAGSVISRSELSST